MALQFRRYIRFTLAAALAVIAVASASEAQAQYRLSRVVPPRKPAPATPAQRQAFIRAEAQRQIAIRQRQAQIAAENQRRLEAFGECRLCANPKPTVSPFLQLPRQIPQSALPLGPVRPGAMNSWQIEAWREFWGLRTAKVRTQFIRWGRYLTAYTKGSVANLKKVTTREVMAPRGKRRIAGNRSKGMCKEAVNDILTGAGILKDRIPGDHARQAAPYLRSQKDPQGRKMFADITADLKSDAGKAPEGAIIVYTGGKSGHIELKVNNQFCSDFCAAEPIDRTISRRVIGIFLPLALGVQ